MGLQAGIDPFSTTYLPGRDCGAMGGGLIPVLRRRTAVMRNVSRHADVLLNSCITTCLVSLRSNGPGN